MIPPAGGIGLHVPTLARAFRDRLRDCSDSDTFQKELQLLWQNIFHVSSDLSPRPELLMVHWAAFEFAVNELVLACEESRYMESIPVAENKALVPLEFLKQDPSFCAFISIQLRLEAPVSSVIPRLLRSLLATGDVDWFCALLQTLPSPPNTLFGADHESHADISVLYEQVISSIREYSQPFATRWLVWVPSTLRWCDCWAETFPLSAAAESLWLRSLWRL